MFDERTAELDIWGGGVGAQTPRTNIWVKPPKLPGLQAGRARQLGRKSGKWRRTLSDRTMNDKIQTWDSKRGRHCWAAKLIWQVCKRKRPLGAISWHVSTARVHIFVARLVTAPVEKFFKLLSKPAGFRKTCFIKLYNRKPLSTYFPFSFVKIVFLFYINFLLQHCTIG